MLRCVPILVGWLCVSGGLAVGDDEIVRLFDGSSTDAWRHKDRYDVGWPIEDGELVVAPGAGSLYSRELFQDFRLHVEFAVPESPDGVQGQGRGNSGLYLQGRYEVQILDSYGKPTFEKIDCASIYRFKTPDVDVSRPPGEWQSYDIVFRAPRFDGEGQRSEHPRLSVWWNGTLVHDDVEITVEYTGAGRWGHPSEPGPIQLQDHGNPVRFRNLWIQRLDHRLSVDRLSGLSARSIGPAGMSGRVAAIAASEGHPRVLYVGAATGGLWRSDDGGLRFRPLFDDQPVASIGAIALDPRDPDRVWVGTGEGNLRNSASVGNGVYRTWDGGQTWTHLGLEKTEHIHRLIVHPTQPETVWVAATGTAWGENPERGVFKTTDGGKTWRRVLFVDERTGAADLAIDPRHPDRLLASMWTARRWPHRFESGGPGSGMFLSEDGGATWKRLTASDGLPAGELGRIGIAFAPSDPDIVYALVEAEKSALLRSTDGGRRWRSVNSTPGIASRPFYYADLRVDPLDPDRVYNLHGVVDVSNDGGRTFETLVPFSPVHPDHHALWIDPEDGRTLIDGNDGGVAISRDRGETWRFVSNLPLAQFYHLSVDDDLPYHVYGGMQDNGSWRGPSQIWENGGIRNHHWDEVGFGDGFATLPHPQDSLSGYSMSQEGHLKRWDLRTGERQDIRPVHPDGTPLRFSWNAGLAIDPFAPDGLYFGSQFVHTSTDRGDTWRLISPDLTTNRVDLQTQHSSGGLTLDVTGAENHTTILTIAPSPRSRDVIWVGTDDGRLQVTRDGGAQWTSVEARLPGLPEPTWIPHVEASTHDPASAFVVLDGHRRADWTPYVYRTDDFGETWTSIATDEIEGYCHVIEQDPVDPDLLFLGTELGLWVTVDGGQQWLRWRHGVPTVGVRALTVHPRTHDLIIGTHGRAAYILDDISPLRDLTDHRLAAPLALHSLPAAQQYRVRQTGASRFPGHTEYRGVNVPYGVVMTYSLLSPASPEPSDAERLTLEVQDASGEVVRKEDFPARPGLQRLVWDLRRDAFRSLTEETDDDDRRGPEVPAGAYLVTLRFREVEVTRTLHVFPDPRQDIRPEDRRAKWDAILAVGEWQERAAEATARLRAVRRDLDLALDKIGHHPKAPLADLEKKGRELRERITELERLFVRPEDRQGIEARDWAEMRLRFVLGSLRASWEAPTEAQRQALTALDHSLTSERAQVDAFLAGAISEYRKLLTEHSISLLNGPAPRVSVDGQ